jgi:hypothetical protein
MSDHENRPARAPEAGQRIPGPMGRCKGELHIVRAGDTLFLIARHYGVTVQDILDANPQIEDPNVIFVGQLICVPIGSGPAPGPGPGPCPDGELVVFSVRFFTKEGEEVPTVDGAVQLPARVIVRARFNRPVSRAFFFLEPTGTETCELASLIGIDCPSAVTGVAEILWDVPRGTLGRVFVVACLDNVCAKSDDVLVVRD